MFTPRSFGKVGVEAYAAYALRAWLAQDQTISDRTRRFAKWSAICSFALGMAGQVAYHLMAQAGMARAPWPVTTIVSCLPVLVLGMGTALAHMLRADAETSGTPGSRCSCGAGPALRGPGGTGPRAADGWPGPVRQAGPQRSRARTTARPQEHGTWAAASRAAAGSGSYGRPEAGRSGQAGLAAGVAQWWGHGGLQGAERRSAHAQRRTGRARWQWVSQPGGQAG
jgi:hypothetical protein